MSTLNKLIANVQKSSSQINNENFLNNRNIVCIDTSNNRIGINTIYPKFSIDISGEDAKLKTRDLEATGNSIFNTIDINTINTDNIICNNNIKTKSISSDIIDCSINLIIKPNCSILYESSNTLDMKNANIICKDLSVINLDVSNIDVSNINCKNKLNCSSINVNDNIKCTEISSNSIDCDNISLNNIIIKESVENIQSKFIDISSVKLFSHDASFDNIVVNYDISSKDMYIENIISKDISTINIKAEDANITNIYSNDISCNNIKLENIIGRFSFTELTGVNDCNINNLTINNELNCSLVKNMLIPSDIDISLSYNSDLSSIMLKTNSDIYNVYTNPIYSQIELDDKSGNNIDIDNSNIIITAFRDQLIERGNINNYIDINYKYIPIKFLKIDDIELNNGFSIDTSGVITSIYHDYITQNKLYNININLSLEYLNKYPGDVEVTNYILGIYFYNSNKYESYVKLQDTIIAFDINNNYRSVSLNYVGKLRNPDIRILLTSSNIDDLRQLHIVDFTGNIRLL